MGGKTARIMYSADSDKEHCISCISLVIQDGARKTGPPSRRPTWAYVSDSVQEIKLSKPNDIYIYICRTAALTSRRYILNIYSTNIHTESFKHAA